MDDGHRVAEVPKNPEVASGGEIATLHTRLKLLVESGEVLASSADFEATFSKIARLVVKHTADLCVIELAGEEASSTPVEIFDADPARAQEAREAWTALAPGAQLGISHAREQERATLHHAIGATLASKALLEQPGAAPAHAWSSAVVAPMMARGTILGAVTWIRYAGKPDFNDEDLRVAEDLSSRAAIALHAERLHLEAQRDVRKRDDMLGLVSHDLRNPLSSIVMRSALLLQTLEPGSSIRPEIEAINRSCLRMKNMLRDLMDFSAIQSGTILIERKATDVAQVLLDFTDAVRPLMEGRSFDVRIDLPNRNVQASCDRDRLFQILSNLVDNAIKFTPKDGHIEVQASRTNGAIRFSVSDTGPGIKEDDLARIFQKFTQSAPSRKGLGLGLYIVKMLVDAHDGELWVESTRGVGSTFFFTLPVAGAAPSTRRPALRSVLIVDDDDLLRTEIAELLSEQDHVVVQASDGRQALTYLRTHPAPALMLLDMMMPNLDGWELAATLGADPLLASIPIVVMTCLDRSQVGGSLRGIAGYLKKPPQLEELMQTVERFCAPAPHSSSRPVVG